MRISARNALKGKITAIGRDLKLNMSTQVVFIKDARRGTTRQAVE